MQKNGKKIVIGLGIAAGLAWWLSRKSAAVDSLRWFIAGVKYDKTGSNITRSLFKITIRVENPTADTVGFDQFTGKVMVQGATLSTLDVSGAGKGIRFMPGNTDIVLDAVVSHLVGLSVIKDFVTQVMAGNFKEAYNHRKSVRRWYYYTNQSNSNGKYWKSPRFIGICYQGGNGRLFRKVPFICNTIQK